MKKHFVMVQMLLIGIFLAGVISCKDENEPSNTAITIPSVSTSAVSDIHLVSAKCGGTITSNGGALVTARGVCWNTIPDPTIADDTTMDGQGSGIFTSFIDGLAPGVTYYVRAYASNSEGTGYGNNVSFTTLHLILPIFDIDGNEYQVVQIGNQIWMAANLRVTHYNNGETINLVPESIAWSNLTSEALCEYDNSDSNATIFGYLYNGYAVTDSRNICPEGWHIPSDIEWNVLQDYLGGEVEAGGKMKETGLNHWTEPNSGANNSSGFYGLPGGMRSDESSFSYLGFNGYFWSSSLFQTNDLYCSYLLNNSASLLRTNFNKNYGLSVRCVKE